MCYHNLLFLCCRPFTNTCPLCNIIFQYPFFKLGTPARHPHPMNQTQPQKPGSNFCLALLATAAVKISTEAVVSSTWRQTRKFIQVRTDTLIFFNKTPTDNLSNATQLIQLRPKHQGTIRTSTLVSITNCPFSFNFPDIITASEFHNLINATIEEIAKHSRSARSFTEGIDSSHLAFSSFAKQSANYPTLSAQMADPRDAKQFLSVKRVPKSDAFFSATDLNNLINERIALQAVSSTNSPFIQQLVHAYQDKLALYFVTDRPEASDVQSVMEYAPDKRIPEESARLLFIETVMALSDVHDCGVTYGDFQPCKLGLTETGHVKLCDFSHAKRIEVDASMMVAMPVSMRHSMMGSISSSSTALSNTFPNDTLPSYYVNKSKTGPGSDRSFVTLFARGSVDYGPIMPMAQTATKPLIGNRSFLPPELLSHTQHQPVQATSTDIWALGVTLYIMVTGRHPFMNLQTNITTRSQYQQYVLTKPLKFPSFLSSELKTLLSGLLEKNPAERFTISHIQQSEWLKNVDWATTRANAQQDLFVDDIVSLLQQSRIRRMTTPINIPNDTESLWTSDAMEDRAESSVERGQRKSPYRSIFAWTKYRVNASTRDAWQKSKKATSVNLLGFEFNRDSF